jgi:hypothetical protein
MMMQMKKLMMVDMKDFGNQRNSVNWRLQPDGIDVNSGERWLMQKQMINDSVLVLDRRIPSSSQRMS